MFGREKLNDLGDDLKKQKESLLARLDRERQEQHVEDLPRDTVHMTVEERLHRLEVRRDAHYKTTLQIQEDLIHFRYEVQEMLSIFNRIKSVLTLLIVAGKLLKWVVGIVTAAAIAWGFMTGHFKSTFWD